MYTLSIYRTLNTDNVQDTTGFPGGEFYHGVDEGKLIHLYEIDDEGYICNDFILDPEDVELLPGTGRQIIIEDNFIKLVKET